MPPFVLRSFAEIPAFAVLGVGCGVLAVLFMSALIRSQRIAAILPGPAFARPALAGLAVGLIAWVEPRVLGVGYEAMDIALRGDFAWYAVLLLLAAKFAATVLCLGLGFHGGVFSPSLILGALFGAVFGSAAYALFPGFSSGPAAYALVGAAAVSSAVLGAPISTALIVFELTADYRLAVVVMGAVLPRMAETGHDRLAVMEPGADGADRLVGVIDRVDALAVANRALLAALRER